MGEAKRRSAAEQATPKGTAYRLSQGVRSIPRALRTNAADYVHGVLVTNRKEHRAAIVAAKKFGCNPFAAEHNERCPKFKPKMKTPVVFAPPKDNLAVDALAQAPSAQEAAA